VRYGKAVPITLVVVTGLGVAVVACSAGTSSGSGTIDGGIATDSGRESGSSVGLDGGAADAIPEVIGCDAGAANTGGCGYLDVTLSGGFTASDCCYGCGSDVSGFSWEIDQDRASFQIDFPQGQTPLLQTGTFALDSAEVDGRSGRGPARWCPGGPSCFRPFRLTVPHSPLHHSVSGPRHIEPDRRISRIRLGSSDGRIVVEHAGRSRVPNGVGCVALANEALALSGVARELGMKNLHGRWIAATTKSCAHDEAASIGRVSDEVDDGLVGPQRAATPAGAQGQGADGRVTPGLLPDRAPGDDPRLVSRAGRKKVRQLRGPQGGPAMQGSRRPRACARACARQSGVGYTRIRDALRGLKIEIGRTTVATMLAEAVSNRRRNATASGAGGPFSRATGRRCTLEAVDGALREQHVVEHREPLGGVAIARDDRGVPRALEEELVDPERACLARVGCSIVGPCSDRTAGHA
jgi:hypothetical protein